MIPGASIPPVGIDLSLLQILGGDGEDARARSAPLRVGRVLRRQYRVEQIDGSTRDRWLEEVTRVHRATRPVAWLAHGLAGPGSLRLYPAAMWHRVPIIQFVHDFRPFCVAGRLWAGGRPLHGRFLRNCAVEIRHRAWRDSYVHTAGFALNLCAGHALGWFARIRAWVVPSKATRDQFVRFGVDPRKIFVVPHAWETQESMPPEFPTRGHFLFLGPLVEAKGARVLLEAWRLLARRLGGATPELVLAGEGPLAREAVEAARRVPQIRCLGEPGGDERRALLRGAVALVAPSIACEPVALAACEAYDAARPILGSGAGALVEVVRPGVTGLLHRPGDAEELSHQVYDIHHNPSFARQMGEAGRAWLTTHSGGQTWLDRFQEALEAAVRRRPPRREERRGTMRAP